MLKVETRDDQVIVFATAFSANKCIGRIKWINEFKCIILYYRLLYFKALWLLKKLFLSLTDKFSTKLNSCWGIIEHGLLNKKFSFQARTRTAKKWTHKALETTIHYHKATNASCSSTVRLSVRLMTSDSLFRVVYTHPHRVVVLLKFVCNMS